MNFFTIGGKKKIKNRSFLAIGCFSFCLFVAAAFLISNIWSVRAASVPSIITYQGKLVQNGLVVSTTQSMYFFLYDAVTSGNIVYSAGGTPSATTSISVTPSSAGLFNVDLGGSSTTALSSDLFRTYDTLYLEVKIGSETLSPRKRLTASPYALNSKFLDGYFATSTPTTTAYIPVADSSGGFTFSAVTSSAVTLGGVRRTSWSGTFLGLTTSSNYSGALAFNNGTVYRGYEAGNRICALNYSLSHLCRTEEIVATIDEKDIDALFTNNAESWIANGPPGYTAFANDCGGFTTSSISYLGAFWIYNNDGGGSGFLINCGETKKLACCK